ncbi:UNVERIFIED_CONTAM: A disintegrin and metalloproteinase with thrombospondin motifs 7 [Gekko kuhli]
MGPKPGGPNIGCDFEIDSYTVEDRCGVCQGDGSTCQTVKKTFEKSEGRGYVDVGLIPAGAREIQIEEVAEAENFLALRSEDPKKYFLNGDWTIQWNGDYPVAGTTFTYERTGNWENLTSPGPTEEPVWIQLKQISFAAFLKVLTQEELLPWGRGLRSGVERLGVGGGEERSLCRQRDSAKPFVVLRWQISLAAIS